MLQNISIITPPAEGLTTTTYAPLAQQLQGTLWSYRKDCDVPCGVIVTLKVPIEREHCQTRLNIAEREELRPTGQH